MVVVPKIRAALPFPGNGPGRSGLASGGLSDLHEYLDLIGLRLLCGSLGEDFAFGLLEA